jgi:hypothetical protein
VRVAGAQVGYVVQHFFTLGLVGVHMYCDYCLLGDDDLARVVVVSVVAVDKVVVMVAGLVWAGRQPARAARQVMVRARTVALTRRARRARRAVVKLCKAVLRDGVLMPDDQIQRVHHVRRGD